MKAKPQQADDSLDPRNLKRIRQRVRKWLKQPDASKLRELWPLDGGGFNYFAFHADILYYTRVNMEEIRRPLLDFEQLGVELSPREEAFFLRLRAHLHVGSGLPKKADELYRQAWDQFVRFGDQYEQFRTAIGWTLCLSSLGAFERIDHIREMLLPWRDSTSSTSVLRFDANYAISVSLRGDYLRAAALHAEVEKRALRLRDRLEAAMSAYNLGLAYLYAGDPVKANAPFRRSHRRAQELELSGMLLGNELCRLQIDLLSGQWSGVDKNLHDLSDRLIEVGHVPQALAARRHLAVLLGNLGATKRAEKIAADLEHDCDERGMALTKKKMMLLRSKLLLSLGRPQEATQVLNALRRLLGDQRDSLLAREAELEYARVLVERGMLVDARSVLGPLLSVPDQNTHAAALSLLAATNLHSEEFETAMENGHRAHKSAQTFPAVLDRPAIAMVVAEAAQKLQEQETARQWLKKCVAELGRHHAAIESSALRGEASSRATNLYQRAVDLSLTLGGHGSVSRAVDLLSRSRSMPLLELMLRGIDFPQRGKLARMLRSRDRWLEDGVIARESSIPMEEISTEMDRTFRRAPAQVRSLMQRMRFQSWRPALGDQTVIQFDLRATIIRAFVIQGDRPPVLVELPEARAVLDNEWRSFSLAMESLASADEPARQVIATRTRVVCSHQLDTIHDALIKPLQVEGNLVVVPDGLLHSIPVEAIMERAGVMSRMRSIRRVAHPALLTVRRGKRRDLALLIHDGESGRTKEVNSLRRMFLTAGFRCRTASTRPGLRRALKERPGIVHIAAHGSHSDENWLLNGLRLSDGWIGFEEFRGGSLNDALVYVSSCESGLLRDGGNRAMAGWMGSLFGAGASELLLTLWKIDDAGSRRFARAFYTHWLRGTSARRAASAAREMVRQENLHPFSWAPFFAVG